MNGGLVLLDRDGTLNVDRAASVCRPGEFRMIPGAAEAVARLNHAGVRVAVVTNQSAVGRGLLAPETLEHIHARLRAELAAAGAHLDALFWCPDTPDGAGPRRKPAPGMLLEALARFGADAARTPMIGDALRDLQAAAAAGCPRMLVRTGKGAETEAAGLPPDVQPAACFDDLGAAVDSLLGRRLS